jgi:hypothetical protein
MPEIFTPQTAYICTECGSHGPAGAPVPVAGGHACPVCRSPVNVYGGTLAPVYAPQNKTHYRYPCVCVGTDVLQNKAVVYACDTPAEARAICDAANRHWYEFYSEHETWEDLVAFEPDLERFCVSISGK